MARIIRLWGYENEAILAYNFTRGMHTCHFKGHVTLTYILLNATKVPQFGLRPVWAKQLTRLPCLVVYVKFQFVYTTKSKMGSQLLLATTSSHVQL